MKHKKRFILASMLLAGAIAVNVSANGGITYGDVDRDGEITATDSVYTLLYSLDNTKETLDSEQLAAAAVSGNTIITAQDAALILLKALNSGYKFPINTAGSETTSEAAAEAASETATASDSSVETTTEAYIYLVDGASYSSASNGNVTIENDKISITAGGTYNISGSLTDGQLIINSADDVDVVLNGVSITSSIGSPFYSIDGDLTIKVQKGSVNTFTDAAVYTDLINEDLEPDSCIFGKDRITIKGAGSLIVNANAGDGIASKDELKIKNGSITINAADDGLRGKDFVEITGGTLDITAVGCGIKSTAGYLTINENERSVNISINAKGKGMKAETDLTITAGTFDISSTDDSIHSNGTVTIDGGTASLTTDDDGIHADTTMTINGGDIDILKSYEGIEGTDVIINNGSVYIISSDDGINGAGGNDGSGMNGADKTDPWNPGRPGEMGGGNMSASTGTVTINGGYVYVNASGDGVDANGALTFNGGTVLISGPTDNGNSAIDADGSISYNGGELLAIGSSGMMEYPSASASTGCGIVYSGSSITAGSQVVITDADANVLAVFNNPKAASSIIYCSETLSSGDAISIYTGGTYTGSLNDDGYATGGLYNTGTLLNSITLTSNITVSGGNSGFGRMTTFETNGNTMPGIPTDRAQYGLRQH